MLVDRSLWELDFYWNYNLEPIEESSKKICSFFDELRTIAIDFSGWHTGATPSTPHNIPSTILDQLIQGKETFQIDQDVGSLYRQTLISSTSKDITCDIFAGITKMFEPDRPASRLTLRFGKLSSTPSIGEDFFGQLFRAASESIQPDWGLLRIRTGDGMGFPEFTSGEQEACISWITYLSKRFRPLPSFSRHVKAIDLEAGSILVASKWPFRANDITTNRTLESLTTELRSSSSNRLQVL